jgi:acyl-CoA synthetase (AMP-forming)/AMP-acid ligase II
VLRNCPAFIAIWLACARLGAWMVPVDPTSTARDISRQLDRVRPAVGICAASRAPGWTDTAPGRTPAALERPAVPDRCVAPADRLAVMFTSGTTSEPKGVVLTQHNYANVADTMPGEPGELVLAGVPGADIFLEYLDDPAATGQALVQRDGTTWFHTGDMVARADGAGEGGGAGALRFVGRRDDVIKVSGENVSLSEVEATLAQAPGVLECAVLGRPDPVRDMVPVAYVAPRDAAHPPAIGDLAAWSERNLAAAARPRDWHLIEALPRTSVGKVRRFKL